MHEEKWNELYILSKDKRKRFEEEILRLKVDEQLSIIVDLLPRISEISSMERREGMKFGQIKTEPIESGFTEDFLNLIDWSKIELEIYNFKTQRGYWNLIFDKKTLMDILLSKNYKIKALQNIYEVKDKSDINRLEEIALLVIKKYIDSFYRKYAKRFETQNLGYDILKNQEPLSIFEKPTGNYSYVVQVDKRKEKLIKEIKKLVGNIDELLKEDREVLPRIYFDAHLYVPILLQDKKIDRISPVGLVESEADFIERLREYLEKKKPNFEVYLLRNFPKKGIGFFNLSGFYPDFIMWIKSSEKQFIVFIDPKGLEHTKGLDDEKIQLRSTLKEIEKGLGRSDITLDSFILSKTSYDELKKGRINPPSDNEYMKNHVLFLEDKDWPEKLFNCLKE